MTVGLLFGGQGVRARDHSESVPTFKVKLILGACEGAIDVGALGEVGEIANNRVGVRQA